MLAIRDNMPSSHSDGPSKNLIIKEIFITGQMLSFLSKKCIATLFTFSSSYFGLYCDKDKLNLRFVPEPPKPNV